ncbi:MAG TPA: transglutaminase-like domain-containing protein [Pyrinomonadaceae bacterium]|jgi:regulator of sirC expression with transglutaminase-like and TPR domain
MTPASKLLAREMRRAFAEEVAKPDGSIRLEYAALLVAAEDEAHMNIDVAEYLSRLERWAALARERIAQSTVETPIEAFNRFMFDELGLAGNQRDYYSPRNSYLNEVIDRRTGIPITLSIVYMGTGRRVGFSVEGVGLPGHFITRVREEKEDSLESTLVDPFHGRTLDMDDCQQRLDEVYGGQVALTEAHLRGATTREILVRLLTNLKAIYARADLHRQALVAVERILLLTPHAHDERRDRAALLSRLDRLPEAIAETESYLQLVPDAPDAAEAREQLKALQRRQATRN